MTLRPAPDERSIPDLLAFGVVNLDKPPGPSAHQVAAWVRDLTDQERAAHAGTLDPKVTGCLPLLLGDATRMAQVFDDSRKEYVAVLECHGSPPADLDSVVAEFEAPIYQKPPRKSAVKRRLRVREIHALDVLEVDGRQALLRVRCESGTYIRKLCHDIGLALGTGAHMGHLRRTATDPFDDTTLATLEDLADALTWYREDGDEAPLRDVVQPAERALVDLARVTIAPSAAESVADGAPVYAPGVIDADQPDAERPLVACYTPNDAAVCLGRLVGDPDADSGVVVELERVLV
ncbi:RNA-guided pseudouridylation complex pseudouridine synthase subunit Cbf5 [Halorientalis marina]|uniref:RNA-guided pseudouridylation complex pseudouridine synthase subunit Cbf5 n=1 Tax=Halorientalis marina TaxID=2931976 RepID=UPI001FF39344|nr:RNA-guided pseudouridylation complex pseudouridine synthase subunit Cbf5 [Halorientalis marina]